MKKFFILTLVISFLFVAVGCAPDTGVINDDNKSSGVMSLMSDQHKENEFFETVYYGGNYRLVYDVETGVMYTISDKGEFFVLVDEKGNPKNYFKG